MVPLLDEICRLLKDGESVVLAMIFDHHGSTPRTSGARMIIRADGKIAGTIGGGLLEARVIERAAFIFETGCSVVEHFALDAAAADSMDMICGGNLSVLLEFIAADQGNRQVFERWRDLTAAGGTGFVLTRLPCGRPPSQTSVKFIAEPGGITFANTPAAAIDLPSLIETYRQLNKAAVIYHAGEKFHIEPVASRDNLILFGAGHVSQSVARLACTVGFRITVVDDRPEFANRQRFGCADEILVPEGFTQAFETLAVDRSSYIVIVTRGHVHDHTVLAQALKTNAGYIGMIGSKRKRDAIYAALLAANCPRADIERVHSPIGLEIKAETPEEIAVSIVAELIAVRAELKNKRSAETGACGRMLRLA